MTQGFRGHQQSLRNALEKAGFLKRNQWISSKSLLVVLGDVLGNNSTELDWLANIEESFVEKNSQLVILAGQKEMQLANNPKSFKSLSKELGLGQKEFEQSQPPLGENVLARRSFLGKFPVALKIGTWLFSHSGFCPPAKKFEIKKTSDNLFQISNFPTWKSDCRKIKGQIVSGQTFSKVKNHISIPPKSIFYFPQPLELKGRQFPQILRK